MKLTGLFLIFSLFALPSMAQEGRIGEGHMENHDWYQDLRSPKNVSCCNGSDCRPTRAYRTESGKWVAKLEGEWTPIPDDIVLDADKNKNPLHAHICAMGKTIFCFIPGQAGG